MIGAIANQRQALSRRILREHALGFIIACYRALMAAYWKAGFPTPLAPPDFQQEALY